jgi:large subunit ribosomal protein L6
MSRIGKQPIPIPEGVRVALEDHAISVKGPKGDLTCTWPQRITVTRDGDVLHVERPTDAKQDKAYHGLVQRLISNMVRGVTEGFRKELEIQGVGYRAEMQGETLVMQLGFSHEIRYDAPQGITISTPRQTAIVVEGVDKQRVGQTAAEIRRWRPPDPYKGKGIRHVGEHVRRKAGKRAI